MSASFTARTERIAGLRTLRLCTGTPAISVVMLHGRTMEPESLAPFATSLGVAADVFVPQGPVTDAPGFAWWPTDHARRRAQLAAGPRDLHDDAPAGVPAARALLLALLESVRGEAPERPVAVLGFSQGGMLACDALLRDHAPINALGLLSSSRITAAQWEPRLAPLRGLPVLVSHGRDDEELSFAAGEGLRDLCARGGATVTWVPFDGGHEIPLVVWRAIRRLLRALTP